MIKAVKNRQCSFVCKVKNVSRLQLMLIDWSGNVSERTADIFKWITLSKKQSSLQKTTTQPIYSRILKHFQVFNFFHSHSFIFARKPTFLNIYFISYIYGLNRIVQPDFRVPQRQLRSTIWPHETYVSTPGQDVIYNACKLGCKITTR